LRKKEKGFSLIEVIIAIAILGIIGVAFFSGLGTASRVTYTADERATAENLARSQMEYVKEQPYLVGGGYDEIDLSEYPASYDIDVIANPLAGALSGIQEIVVQVYHQGTDPEDLVFELRDYKVDR
jgi:prepilin-type N-terminal cleavage/methylation domain-containing protein